MHVPIHSISYSRAINLRTPHSPLQCDGGGIRRDESRVQLELEHPHCRHTLGGGGGGERERDIRGVT